MYPCLKINDIETTIHWYIDFLGFQCVYKSSLKHPDRAILEKGDQKLFLITDENQKSYASSIIVTEVFDIKSEFDSLESRGLIIVQPVQKGIFGELEFVIKDYEDNKIIYRQAQQ